MQACQLGAPGTIQETLINERIHARPAIAMRAWHPGFPAISIRGPRVASASEGDFVLDVEARLHAELVALLRHAEQPFGLRHRSTERGEDPWAPKEKDEDGDDAPKS